jgi:hypothetical protein
MKSKGTAGKKHTSFNFKASAIRSSADISHFSFFLGAKERSSTSKHRVALGGMVGGLPLSPYP